MLHSSSSDVRCSEESRRVAGVGGRTCSRCARNFAKSGEANPGFASQVRAEAGRNVHKNHVKTIKACKNVGSKAEPHGRGVEKVAVVASPTHKYFSRRTGNAKRHAGSCFDFMLSWSTCTHVWSARKRSQRWSGGSRLNSVRFTESPHFLTTR